MSGAPPNGLLRAEIKHLKEINAELLTALHLIIRQAEYCGGHAGVSATRDSMSAMAEIASDAIAKAKAP